MLIVSRARVVKHHMAAFCSAEEMANRGRDAAKLFITLPAEVWAIALKPPVFLEKSSRRHGGAGGGRGEEEATCLRMTARELLGYL